MKKGILYSSLAGLGVVLLSVSALKIFDSKHYYKARSQKASAMEIGEEGEEHESEGFKGAAEYLHMLRANPATGEIEPADVLNAKNQLASMVARQKKSTLGLQWSELGPDNIGGRTRAFLIDKNDPQTFYAGSVSGGLFKSTTSGSSWTAVNDMKDNLAVTCIAQAPNGDIYYGTGESVYYIASGTKAQGILGGGVYKSTDGGNSFSILSSTIPTSNVRGADWASVGKIAVDPNNSNKIYAATNNGLRMSTDGGNSWTMPISNSNEATDMFVTASGTLWVKVGSSLYKAAGGDLNNVQEITALNPGANGIQRNQNRMRMAVSPQDENYVYVVGIAANGGLDKAYRSTDGGASWSVIGQANTFLIGMFNDQGNYDLAVTVDPQNKDRVLVGGVTLWEWSAGGGWQQIATNNRFLANSSLYVHSDVHNIVYAPNDPQRLYVCCDGGIFRSTDNGLSWKEVNRNYSTIQFYNIGVGDDGSVLGGAQDNSNILINPNSPSLKLSGTTLNSGDGGYAEISKLAPNVLFLESQYGNTRRSTDGGNSFDNFFDLSRMAVDFGPGDHEFATFITPFTLYENVNDGNSIDSITFSADSAFLSLGFGSGRTKFSGQFNRPQTTAKFIAQGLKIKAGKQVVVSDASGNLSGDGTGSFDPNTGSFSVEFNNPVVVEIFAKAAIKYDAGSKIFVKSATNDISIGYTLANGLTPNQSIKIQDPVQSAFFIGLTGHPKTDTNNQGGIWMTRGALSNLTGTPEWFHIGDLSNKEEPLCMAVSNDGDVLYVGTNFGRVYRFSNLINARDSASADIDDKYVGKTVVQSNTSVVIKTLLSVSGQLSGGRVVTSIAIHPADKNKVVVTAGNYGSFNHVYYSSNAASLATFKAVDGNLPNFPVYSATFNSNGPASQLIVGAEDGVFVTDDINASTVIWSQEITGMANVPVFDLVQKRTVRYDQQLFGNMDGAIYAGTHGRGVFKTSTTEKVSIDEPKLDEKVADRDILNLYPNPASSRVFVDLQLQGRSDITITVRDISGKLVKSMTFNKLAKETDKVEMNVGNLPTGTYIVTLINGNQVKSGKLIKQ